MSGAKEARQSEIFLSGKVDYEEFGPMNNGGITNVGHPDKDDNA